MFFACHEYMMSELTDNDNNNNNIGGGGGLAYAASKENNNNNNSHIMSCPLPDNNKAESGNNNKTSNDHSPPTPPRRSSKKMRPLVEEDEQEDIRNKKQQHHDIIVDEEHDSSVNDDNAKKLGKSDKNNDNKKTKKDHDNDDDNRTSKDYYFDSYAHHAIHEEMLKDEVRTRTYEMAIKQNAHLFKDKIVLDVGCGTGILSMFAAQAGAKHVYAVDCSTIIQQARQIIQLNHFEHQVTCIQGKMEEITLPVAQVDVIISEWMGYFLLYESMLDTVLYARDKYLVPGGILFPDKAIMYICGVEDGQVKKERLDFWDDVYGFNMTPIKDIAIKEPVVDIVDAKQIVTNSQPILHLDILTCTKDDLQFSSTFNLISGRNDYIHGLVAYFECAFTQVHKPIGFSTAPYARYTHWKQTIFYLEDTLTICEKEELSGSIYCKPNVKNQRDLDIYLSLEFNGKFSKLNLKNTKYRLR